MRSTWFWKNWTRNFRWIWFIATGLFALAFIFFCFTYYQGAEGVIHWEKIQEQKVLESTIHSFQVGPFELDVPAENYVILEYFNGSEMVMNSISSVIFTTVLIACALVLLTVITTLERFWYFVGMGLFILFVVTLRLEVLAIFLQRNQVPTIVILAVFTLVSYYFHALKPTLYFQYRLLVFVALALVATAVIYLFAGVPYPMLHLAVTGYTPALIISVLFIVMIAHEIPAAFVYMASQGNSKSLTHFSIISVVYIFNILITCLHEINVIHWNFIYINLYLLLSVSAILGLWGFKLRETLYSNIISFAPYGAFLYVALATICFITIGQFFATANDAALRIIRDVIIFSHVGYGIIFLTYVFSNFVVMLGQNLPVYKVLYKPTRMPYFSFRFAGLIMTLAFVFYSDWKQYVYNGIAGFYNNIGDLYEILERNKTAEAYYVQGASYGFENNHANYALGAIEGNRFDFDDAHHHYALANGRRPTAFSLINDGNLYVWKNSFFDAIKAYQRGIQALPQAGELDNNLGSVYGRIHKLDSAVYYLNKARKHSNAVSSAETNFFAIAAQEYLPINSDSVLRIFKNPSEAALANAVALATTQQQPFHTPLDVLKQKRLTLYSATLLSNYCIQHAKTVDSTFVNEAYKIASDSLNKNYSEALKSSLAFAYYFQGNVSKALKVVGELAYVTQSHQGKFNYIMGLWALEQNSPVIAASYFNYAVESDYKEGKLYYAIALAEAQKTKEARIAWDTVANRSAEGERAMAISMEKILNASEADARGFSDPEKYQFCRYRITPKDTLAFNTLVKTFTSNDYKAQALLDMTRRQFAWDNLSPAIRYMNQIGGLKLTDKRLYTGIQHMELALLAKRKELKNLASQINKGVDFDGRFVEKIYYTALMNEAANDTINASKNFAIVGTYNPYFEDGIIAAADYFRMRNKDDMKAYTILVEAIQVNTHSVKLLKAYAAEAIRLGFSDYAVSALQRIDAIYAEIE